MGFIFGCLAIIAIIVSLVMSMKHSEKNDYCIVHWLFGFVGALVFIGFMVLGTYQWFD